MTIPDDGTPSSSSSGQPALSASSTPIPVSHPTAVRLSELLDSLGKLGDEASFLEREIPPLRARLEAVEGGMWREVIQARRDLVARVRAVLDGSPSRWPFHRDARDLLEHLAADLEERFGVRVRTDDDRWNAGDEEIDEDPFDGGSFEEFASREPRNKPPAPSRNRPSAEGAARGVYRALALQLHPDKTRDPSERDRRTILMQELTEAWRERDLGRLLQLLDSHGDARTRAAALDGIPATLVLERLEEECAQLRNRIRSLRHGDLPPGATDWMPYLRDPELFEKLLRKRRSVPRRELEEIRRWLAQWSLPGGLERFLREVPSDEWPERV